MTVNTKLYLALFVTGILLGAAMTISALHTVNLYGVY